MRYLSVHLRAFAVNNSRFCQASGSSKTVVASAAKMEWLYSKGAKVVTIMLVSSTRI